MKLIPVEPTFDRCVHRAGGVRAEEHFGGPLDAENADYVFAADRVVAELKCLEKDPLSDPAFQDKIIGMYDRWAAAGKVPAVQGPIAINTRALPRDCAIEFLGLFKSQLENSYLRKANRQIRNTKKQLGWSDGKGLLILANEGNYTLDPAVMFNILCHSLRKQYTSIDSVIYFSVNLSVDAPEVAADCLFWASCLVEDRPMLSEEFLKRLRSAWIAEVEAELGEPVPQVEARNVPDEVDRLRFRGRRRR